MADVESEHLAFDGAPGREDVAADVFAAAAQLELERLAAHQRELVGTVEHAHLHAAGVVRLEMDALVVGARHALLRHQVAQHLEVLHFRNARHHRKTVVRRRHGREDLAQVGEFLEVLVARPALVAHRREIVIIRGRIIQGIVEILQVIEHEGVSHTTNVNKNL